MIKPLHKDCLMNLWAWEDGEVDGISSQSRWNLADTVAPEHFAPEFCSQNRTFGRRREGVYGNLVKDGNSCTAWCNGPYYVW
jgi:hypothetical protein